LDLLFAAKRLSPAEAHELGIVDRVFPAAEAARGTHDYADKLAQGATTAIGAMKLAVWQGIDRPLQEGLALEKKHVTPVLTSSQFREGVRAFLEKRPPKFHP
jgi:enoyl-CoA hydratase/carnithine racemase